MDHTIALIQRSHDGDEKAREQLVEENTGLVWCSGSLEGERTVKICFRLEVSDF